jgi:uncharacterized protein
MTTLRAGEMHRFEVAGARFAYLVPSAAVFALDETACAVLDALDGKSLTHEQLRNELGVRFPADSVDETLRELVRVHALGRSESESKPQKALPVRPFPLQTLVLNVTNQCNLSCGYCYEYGEDRIPGAATEGPRFMSEATARAAVDFMLKESGESRVAHLTFFGGETLLNLPVLKASIAYARTRAAELGKEVDFSMTTNATLLRSDVIQYLADNDVGVTISIDGPKDVQDGFRVFKGGAGSYDVVLPKIQELLQRHKRHLIGARVTLTAANLDVKRIFRHLTEEIGFAEVGFAPATTAAKRDYAIAGDGYEQVLEQFRALAREFLEYALAGRHHGFSNVKDTLEEIHKGMSKPYPCGAGLGLLGVSTDGDVALCHRFAGSNAHKLGSVTGGIDREQQARFLEESHIAEKTDCSRCWARPVCAGGCYHEAWTRYGDARRPNLHYCEWIRGWIHTCLEIYGELAVRRPEFLRRLDERVGA